MSLIIKNKVVDRLKKLKKLRNKHVYINGVGVIQADAPRTRKKVPKDLKKELKKVMRKRPIPIKDREKPKAPVGIVSKTPMEDKEAFYKWLSTTAGFIEGFTKLFDEQYELRPTKLYPYQRSILKHDDKNRCIVKARQTGFSQLISLEGLAKCMLKPDQTSIFCSFNEDEAKEKIRYAREAYDTLPRKFQLGRPLIVDNKTSLEFSPIGGGNTTRMLSHPQRDIRGKARADIYLDELAHYIYGKSIYISAGPATVRGGGSLTVASTPLGKKDIFWEIVANEDGDFNDFKRFSIPWWSCSFYTKDVKQAKKECPFLTTDERIEKFAKSPLKRMRKMYTLEDFQQEFELEFIDELTSFISIDLIKSCMPMDKNGVGVIPLYNNPYEVVDALDKKKIAGSLLAGFDVGRKKDVSEFVILIEEEKTNCQKVILRETFRNMRFKRQEDRVREYLRYLPIVKLGIDATAIGNNLAENLSNDYGSRIEAINFSNQWKEEAATNLKIRMENRGLLLPLNKDIKSQFHSIKKRMTTLGKNRFDVDENAKHHADLFWGIVLGSSMGFAMESNIDLRSVIKVKEDYTTKSFHKDETSRLFVPENDRRVFDDSKGFLEAPITENITEVFSIPFIG